MSLMKCTVSGKWNYLSGTHFLCVMENDTDLIWLYPVIPSLTKFYCTDFGALIFPDLESEASDNAFGIIIVSSTIADQSQEEMDYQYLTMDGAEDIASTLVKGAEKAGSLLTKSTSYITSKMNPSKAPTQVPPSVKATVEVAQSVTYAAADLTEKIAEKVGSASQEMGRVLAIHLQRQGSILVEKALGCDSNEANNKVKGAIAVASDAVEGLSIVAGGLEKSASILAKRAVMKQVK
ncbi:protein spartin-like [Drosophila tropicalis]|uniref:protein spartin-like n=1 Tax=Drosophila tropicalis TaxID=46794 RepID=UPI0035ABE05D